MKQRSLTESYGIVNQVGPYCSWREIKTHKQRPLTLDAVTSVWGESVTRN